MNLTKTTVVLVVILLILISISLYLWTTVGVGEPEVDPNVASAKQPFTCKKCGHSFEMTIGKVAEMRRTKGEITCPKCGEGGAQKVILNNGTSLERRTPTTAPASPLGDASDLEEELDLAYDDPKPRTSPPARRPVDTH